MKTYVSAQPLSIETTNRMEMLVAEIDRLRKENAELKEKLIYPIRVTTDPKDTYKAGLGKMMYGTTYPMGINHSSSLSHFSRAY